MYNVAVYEGGLAWGGSEEGGWWFWAGERLYRQQTFTERGAIRLAKRLRKRYPPGGDRTNVRPQEPDYEVLIHEPGEPCEDWYPAERPHYE